MENFTALDWINTINDRQLSGQEQDKLNKLLEKDEDFRELFIFLQTAREAALEEKQEKWRTFYYENKPRRISFWKWGLAASIFFLVIAGLWYFQPVQFDNAQDLFVHYAEKRIMGDKIRGGDQKSNQYLAQAEKDFNEGKYESSAKNFDLFFIYSLHQSLLNQDSITIRYIDTINGVAIFSLPDSPRNIHEIGLSDFLEIPMETENTKPIPKTIVLPKIDYKIHLNRAIALRNSAEPKRAIAAFLFLEEKEVFRDEIDWQLALTYLKTNDLTSSVEQLDKIITSGEHDYLEDAKKLKKAINRLPK